MQHYTIVKVTLGVDMTKRDKEAKLFHELNGLRFEYASLAEDAHDAGR